MFFIAKTPLGEFKSTFSNNEQENKIVRETLSQNLHLLENLHFDSPGPDGLGVVTVCLGPDVIKNSVFIIVE